MPTNRKYDQTMLWLDSMMADPDSFNAINAGNAKDIILNQKEALEKLGKQFGVVKRARNSAQDLVNFLMNQP